MNYETERKAGVGFNHAMVLNSGPHDWRRQYRFTAKLFRGQLRFSAGRRVRQPGMFGALLVEALAIIAGDDQNRPIPRLQIR